MHAVEPGRSGTWVPSRYYTVDVSKMGFGELMGLSPWWTFPMVIGIKLFRFKIPSPGGVPEAAPFAVAMEAPDAQDPELREQLSGAVQEAAVLGFHSPVFFSNTGSLIAGNRGIGVILLGATSDAIATSLYSKTAGTSQQVSAVLSWLSDDTFLVTDNSPPGMKASPRSRVQTAKGASLAELVRVHRDRLKSLAATGLSMKPMRTIEQAGAFQEEMERESIRWHVSRGVYVEMTPEQIATARRQVATSGPAIDPLPQISMRIDGVSTTGAGGPGATNSLAQLVWTFSIQDEAGNASLLLEAGIPGGNIVVSKTYSGNIGAGFGSTRDTFLRTIRKLLQTPPETPDPEIRQRKAPLAMEFLGYTTTLAEPEEQITIGRTVNVWAHFKLSLEGVSGALYLQLSETGKEAVMHVMPDLDRAAAFEKLGGLFAG